MFKKLGFIVIILLAAAVSISIAVRNERFKVKEIVIEGNEKVTKREIIKRSGIIAGYTSMFFVERSSISRIKRNSWIKEVRIKKIFPNKVVIKISEHKPFCLIKEAQSIYYLSENGIKTETAKPQKGLDFPIIHVEGNLGERSIMEAIELLKLSKKSDILKWDDISEIIVNPVYGFRLLTNDKRYIDFGKRDIISKWKKVEKIILHSRKFNLKEEYINISSTTTGVIDFNIREH